MALVKVRRVGNSNVITLPAGLAGGVFQPGATVLVEAQDDGTLWVIPISDVDAHVREVARTAIQRRRRALKILEAHDRDAPRLGSEDLDGREVRAKLGPEPSPT